MTAAALSAPLLIRRLLPGVPLLRLADAQALSIPFAAALVRIGCFLAACCHGTATDLPWGVRFPADTAAWWLHKGRGWIPANAPWSEPVHPLQIYFLCASAITGLVLLSVERRKRYDGQTLFVFLFVDGAFKSLLEQLRDPPEIWLTTAAASMSAFGLTAIVWRTAIERRIRLQGETSSVSYRSAPSDQ